ncbi:MAG: hypothetical protein DI544_14865 [Sphingomonas taxi]|uniref:Uncharacterized protein n=1 Tax=Sphingomonas taxi TaxID=1549858 RepID=A0A2W5QK12_9SPHN|nr:MAG: hypothetical protein DI544_14865 [Sphingomonas taxi]
MMMVRAAARTAARSIEREEPTATAPPPARAGRNSDRAEYGIASVNLMTRSRQIAGRAVAPELRRATFAQHSGHRVT